jgi:hypothetical protein
VFPRGPLPPSVGGVLEPDPRPQFIAEGVLVEPLAPSLARTQRAAAELAGEGRLVRYLRTIVVPEDELCLHVFEADSAETVDELGRRAEEPFDRVVAATQISPSPSERRH